MMERYETAQAAQIMVEAVSDELVDQYGIVEVSLLPEAGQSVAMQGIVENLQLVQRLLIYP